MPKSSVLKSVENPPSAEEMATILKELPDEALLKLLAEKRAKGRNDYPLPTLWETMLTSYLLPCPSLKALKTQLEQNDFPSPSASSRFTSLLLDHLSHVQNIKHSLLNSLFLQNKIPSTHLVIGEKILEIPPAKNRSSNRQNRRSDEDADFGEKLLFSPPHMQIKKFYGYRLHFILDAHTALPLASTVAAASSSGTEHIASLLNDLKTHHPTLFKRARYAIGDFTYDNTPFIQTLWDTFRLKPIIELNPNAKAGKTSFHPLSQNTGYCDYGKVFCLAPSSKEKREMIYAGFEKDRQSLKYRCLAANYNVFCKEMNRCPVKSFIRVPLDTDRRLFTPVARSSYKWEQLFSLQKNEAAYRSYLDKTLCLKLPYTRGLAKLHLHNTLNEIQLLARLSHTEIIQEW